MKPLALIALLLATACTASQVTRDLAAAPAPVATNQSDDDDAPHVAAAPAPKPTPSLPIGRPDKIGEGGAKWDNGDGTHGAVACCMPAR